MARMQRWLVLGVVALAACGSFIDNQAARSTYRILARSNEVARRQVDVELARDAAPGGLIQLATFAAAYPDHAGFRELYAEALCGYVVGFVFDDWEDATLGGRPDEAARLEQRLGPLLAACIDANLALLPPAWRAAHGDALVALIARATRAQVPAVLWIATASAVELGLAPLRNLGKLPVVRAGLARSIQLAPGFHDADAELLSATLAAAQSQVMGGEDGGALFARARALVGEGALIVDVMFARGVAVARKDRALFEATLAKVLAADVTRWPERRLSNELARRKARRYLAAEATLIPVNPS